MIQSHYFMERMVQERPGELLGVARSIRAARDARAARSAGRARRGKLSLSALVVSCVICGEPMPSSGRIDLKTTQMYKRTR